MKSVMSPRLVWTCSAAALLAACATTSPQEKSAYDQARAEVQRLEADPLAEQAAAKPLSEARVDLANAETAAKNHLTDDAIHWSYLATRQAQIGEAMTAELRAHQQIARADQERNQIVQDAQRRREDAAERQAREAEQRAQQAEQELAQLKQQQQNEETQRQVDEAQQRAQLAQQQAEQAQAQARQQAQQEVAQARQQAEEQQTLAQQEIEQAHRQEQQAHEQLQAMQAHETNRGPVIVLGNSVLFATGRDEIQPGALPTLRQIVRFLHDHPNEKLRIEGYTDSSGSDAVNDPLSQRRAEAVAKALESEGVDASRIQAIGRGSSMPLASNDTSAGRQQNRRVEVVFSNPEGQFAQQVAEGTDH